jgi:uncharacterized membrane protein HdeD (DUF308 family)
VCCQGTDRNHFFDLGTGLDPGHQRSVLDGYGFSLYLLNALIRGIASYLLIRHPDGGAAGITMLLASFIVGGIFRTGGGDSVPQMGMDGVSGFVSVFFGIYLSTIWPTASAYFIGLAIVDHL